MSSDGNTTGSLVGVPPLGGTPAANANPPIVAETPEEAAWLAKMEASQEAIPEVSVMFDETKALVYADAENTAADLTGPEPVQAAGQAREPSRGKDGAMVPK